MADEWTSEQPCKDGAGRTRASTVFITEDNRIGVLNPPPGVATYSIAEAQALQQRLWSAVLVAKNRGAE
ncbi:MAG: hypothetical protein WBA97_34995 [Actinophytocola sp.]|uniref:hypothetical protein n=1 Tax=Actinophytocola sp. TaxID=1872138 RepID=UPI003C74D4C8